MKVPVYPHPCQHLLLYCLAFLMLGGPSRKDSIFSAGDVRDVGLITRVRKIPWSGKWQPTPVFLPGELHGQRSLAGCSPYGCKDLDMTE